MSSLDRPLRSITLPLLDGTTDSVVQSSTIVPLPSSHLPDELTTPFLYGFEVTAPVHKLVLEESLQSAGVFTADAGDMPQVRPGSYGHLVSHGPGDDLVGSVGCAVDVIVATPGAAPGMDIEKEMDDMNHMIGQALLGGGAGAGAGAGGTQTSLAGELGATGSASDDQGGQQEAEQTADDDSDAAASASAAAPLVVMVRGSFRFVVREVIKTIPYLVAVVDELRDEPAGGGERSQESGDGGGIVATVIDASSADTMAASKDIDTTSTATPEIIEYNDFEDFPPFGGDVDWDANQVDKDNERDAVAEISASKDKDRDSEDDDDDDDDDDDYDDIYAHLSTQELVRRSFSACQAIVDQKLKRLEVSTGMTPLEKSILENAGVDVPKAETQRSQAEEYGAVLHIFRSELIDICPRPIDVHYALALLTAEMADVNNNVRSKILTLTDGIERLRFVLAQAEDKVNKNAARRLTDQITEEVSSDERDLKVGKAELPNWACQIKKGTRVSYFWNEAEGWCDGTVAEDPTMIVDELIIAVTFDDDGSTHKLPFLAEEKVRWRPGDMK